MRLSSKARGSLQNCWLLPCMLNKKNKGLCVAVFRYRFYLLLSLLLLPVYVAAAATLKLAYSDIQSFPFQMGHGRDTPFPPGLSIDIINKVASTLDIDIEYQRLPGKRVLQYIKSGKVDGGFIFSYNPQRAEYARYPMANGVPDSSKRIATIGYYFYKLKGQPFEWDGVSFSGSKRKLVGAHLGFSIVKELKNKSIHVEEVKTTEQLFHMLETKRLPSIAIQDTTAQAYLNENRVLNVERVEPAIKTKDYYLTFSRKFVGNNPELVKKIWQSIAVLREDVISKESSKYVSKIDQ